MNKITVLIVDDDEGICRLLNHHLKALGCNIEICLTLKCGLDRMLVPPIPDYIFLDLNFPEESRASETVKSVPRFRALNPKATIIVISGMIDERIEMMTTTLGADLFRRKTDLHSQEQVLMAIEEAINAGQAKGIEPFEVTSKMLARIQELRKPLVNENRIT